jgi:hypothetical protein
LVLDGTAEMMPVNGYRRWRRVGKFDPLGIPGETKHRTGIPDALSDDHFDVLPGARAKRWVDAAKDHHLIALADLIERQRTVVDVDIAARQPETVAISGAVFTQQT